MSDTTTRIFEKLETISIDVGVIKATMVDRDTLTAAIDKCRKNPPSCFTQPTNGGAKKIGALVGVIVALTAVVVALTQLL